LLTSTRDRRAAAGRAGATRRARAAQPVAASSPRWIAAGRFDTPRRDHRGLGVPRAYLLCRAGFCQSRQDRL